MVAKATALLPPAVNVAVPQPPVGVTAKRAAVKLPAQAVTAGKDIHVALVRLSAGLFTHW